jgi:hypothetical protein
MEVARMRVAFSLVKEHVDVVEKGKLPLDPEANPMIDPRSVGYQATHPSNMIYISIDFPSGFALPVFTNFLPKTFGSCWVYVPKCYCHS